MEQEPKFDFDINPEQKKRLTQLFGLGDKPKFADFTARPDKKSVFSKLKNRFKKKK
jgi:hypothetical protein